MPSRHGIKVSVVDAATEQKMVEYGVQNLNKSNSIRRFVSTKIEAKSGIQFWVKIEVQKPFPFEEEDQSLPFQDVEPLKGSDHKHETRKKHARFDENNPVEEVDENARRTPRISDIGLHNVLPTTRRDDTLRENVEASLPNHMRITKVPFDLMVSIFIDGRKSPECRQMIYLDPKNKRYNESCTLKGRWVEAQDNGLTSDGKLGRAGLLNWVFTDRGIEHIFSNTKLRNDDNGDEDPDMNDLVNGLDGETLKGKAGVINDGKIEVRIRRVVAFDSTGVNQKFKAYHYAGHDEDPHNISNECTHTTTFAPLKGKDGRDDMQTFNLRQVGWNYYKKGENFWAQFVYLYTSRGKLFKQGYIDEYGKKTFKARMEEPEKEIPKTRSKKRPSDAFRQVDEGVEKRRESKPSSTPPSELVCETAKDSEVGEDVLKNERFADRALRPTADRMAKMRKVALADEDANPIG